MSSRFARNACALLAAALLAACGSQVSRDELIAVNHPELGLRGAGNGPVASGTDPASPGTGDDPASVTAGGPAGEVAGGGADGASAGEGQAAGPGSPVAGTPTAGDGEPRTASDIGVTPDTITLGLVASLTGPISGLFNTAAYAADAFVRELNAAGGVDGRRVVLRIVDDGFDAGRRNGAIREMSKQVFAFFGSVGADNGGADVIRDQKIPDVGPALTRERWQNPTYAHLGNTGQEAGRHDNLPRFAKAQGVTRMGYVYFTGDPAVPEANAWRKAYEASGIPTCYTAEVQLVEPDYTVHAVALQRNGCDGVYVVIDTNSSAKLQAAMYRQRYQPKFMLYNYTAYDDDFVRLAGGPDVAEGVYAWLWQNLVEADIPEMKRYVAAMKKHYPDADPKAYNATPNWADGLLLVKALKAAGPNPTRARFLEELAKVRDYDAEGMTHPYPSPFFKDRTPCIHLARLVKGRWQQAWPALGWDCTGKLIK